MFYYTSLNSIACFSLSSAVWGNLIIDEAKLYKKKSIQKKSITLLIILCAVDKQKINIKNECLDKNLMWNYRNKIFLLIYNDNNIHNI